MLFCVFSFSIVTAQKNIDSYGQESNQLISSFRSCLLPVPQRISFSSKTFLLDNNWIITNVSDSENKRAYECLVKGLKEKRTGRQTEAKSATENPPHKIQLIVKNGLVNIGPTTDTDRTELEKQAYKLIISDTGISITANASQGLFYGVQTLLQLVKFQKEKILLPEGEIVDWPDMNVRMIYWDDAHHLEKMDALKQIIREAACYKINAFAIKLEGHFQFQCAPAIVEPYALSSSEYRELTDYARSYFVELVPYLDAPAHVSFILKHPEYAYLKAFQNSNYEFSIINPETDTLLLKMFSELIKAGEGGKYILLSTDEPYYAGKSADEQKQAETLGGRGRLLTEFISRIANKLHKQGRKVIFWGEYPLTPADIPALPSHLINGEYDSSTAMIYKKHGMRQFIYTYTQGEEPLFPSYYPMSSGDSLSDAEKDRATGRVEGMLKTITSAVSEHKADFMGVIIAGWADAGLHPETFWLGYAAGAAAGWRHKGVTAKDLKDAFYHSYYGLGTATIDSVYRLLSRQAQFYDESWDWKPSPWRSPVFGNSSEIYKTPKPASDQTLPMLPVPSEKDLSVKIDWSKMNYQRLRSAKTFFKENDELIRLLHENIRSAAYQRYNLEVMLSVALLCRQNLNMLLHLEHMDTLLKLASKIALKDAAVAVALLDDALDEAGIIRAERNKTLQALTTVWYKEWYPREAEANGRRYLDIVDDVKDHRPARTVDMTYLIYRDLHYPLGKWAEDVQHARNRFAEKKGLPLRKKLLLWEQVN
ncbi:MAG TPA: glycoside hydrolase family 20 zincin-like fold domain-containing protein [Chitinophagaceae bacterium]